MHGHLNVLWGAAGMLCIATLYAPPTPPSLQLTVWIGMADMLVRHLYLTVKCLLCNMVGLESERFLCCCCLYGVSLPLSATVILLRSANIKNNVFHIQCNK